MNSKINILLIEDDKSINTFITTSLCGNGYRVITALTGKEGVSLAASLCPDVILLDLGLPDIDGCDVLKQLRSWSSISVIVISARTKEQDKVTALDLGADDYITKPFQPLEAVARVNSNIRRFYALGSGRQKQVEELSVRDLKLDLSCLLYTSPSPRDTR